MKSNPNERITVEDALNHPFITKYTVSENIDENDDDDDESPEAEETKE